MTNHAARVGHALLAPLETAIERQCRRTKNRLRPANDLLAKAAKQRSEQRDRLERARQDRQREVERRRSEATAAAVAAYHAERAKRIRDGKPVTPTIDEWRERIAVKATAMGDLA